LINIKNEGVIKSESCGQFKGDRSVFKLFRGWEGYQIKTRLNNRL